MSESISAVAVVMQAQADYLAKLKEANSVAPGVRSAELLYQIALALGRIELTNAKIVDLLSGCRSATGTIPDPAEQSQKS